MDPLQAALALAAGAALGVGGALPALAFLSATTERKAPPVALGLVASLAGLVALQLVVLVVWRLAPGAALPVGVGAAAGLACAVTAAGLAAWRRMGR